MVALCASLSGGGIGFLFSIPKAEESAGDSHLAYKQAVNTSLQQIADWLTKIVVGLGLVNLKNAPYAIESLANRVATDEPAFQSSSNAASVTTSFSDIGFLYAYLTTRLYLSRAFLLAKQDELKKAESGLEESQQEKGVAKAIVAEIVPAEDPGQSIGTGRRRHERLWQG